MYCRCACACVEKKKEHNENNTEGPERKKIKTTGGTSNWDEHEFSGMIQEENDMWLPGEKRRRAVGCRLRLILTLLQEKQYR